jgi:hypothetical protein
MAVTGLSMATNTTIGGCINGDMTGVANPERLPVDVCVLWANQT